MTDIPYGDYFRVEVRVLEGSMVSFVATKDKQQHSSFLVIYVETPPFRYHWLHQMAKKQDASIQYSTYDWTIICNFINMKQRSCSWLCTGIEMQVRWDVERIYGRGQCYCSVRISLDVFFLKKTVWRSKFSSLTCTIHYAATVTCWQILGRRTSGHEMSSLCVSVYTSRTEHRLQCATGFHE